MKKVSLSILVGLVVMFSFSGCSSKSYMEAEMRSEYKPVNVDNKPIEDSALIKVADGMIIWAVDGDRKVNFAKVMFGSGLDSIYVSEGEHFISCSRKYDVNIGKTFYKAGHEYFIDYLEEKSSDRIKIYYWIKDLTDNKVVFGKELKKEDFLKEES